MFSVLENEKKGDGNMEKTMSLAEQAARRLNEKEEEVRKERKEKAKKAAINFAKSVSEQTTIVEEQTLEMFWNQIHLLVLEELKKEGFEVIRTSWIEHSLFGLKKSEKVLYEIRIPLKMRSQVSM